MKAPLAPTEFAHFSRDWHLSPGVDTGEFVFFSGVTGVRADGTLADSPETQIRDVFEILTKHLDVAGLTFDDVVEMTSYHVGLRKHLTVFTKVKDEFVRAPYPAWTAIGVSELITAGALIEIRLIAQRGAQESV